MMMRILISFFLFSITCCAPFCITTQEPSETYYYPNAPIRSGEICNTSSIENIGQDKLYLSGYVFDSDCNTTLPNTRMEIWQANAHGKHSLPDLEDNFDCRGII